VIGVLEAILCVIEELAADIVGLLVLAVNGALIALGALLAVIIALLPSMPEPPTKPGSGIIGFLNFFFPLAGVAGILTTMGSLFLGFMAVRVILNWIRAL
jgi:hypothetical protein